jgi:cell division septation protein DedD/nucleoid DNA-binding protein
LSSLTLTLPIYRKIFALLEKSCRFAQNSFAVELANFIKNLLYNHDFVIVPGFGKLITRYKPAEINQGDKTIAPPSKLLVFESDITASDKLLANYIETHKGTTSAVAEKFLSREVKSLNKRLDEGETVLLEGLGYFAKSEGVTRFDRLQETNFMTESFGLSKIDIRPLEIIDSAPAPKPAERPKQVETKPIETKPVEAATKPAKVEEVAVPKPVKKKKSYAFAWIILAFAILCPAGYLGYHYYPEVLSKFKKSAQPEIATVAPVKPKPTQKDTTKTSDLEQFFDSSTDKKKALAIEKSAPQDLGTYYIIAGSFKSYAKAKVLASELEKEGYKPEVIEFGQEKFRVSLGEYKTKKLGLAELTKIRAVKGPDAVWLLPK